jgi:DNA ligase-1
MYSIIQELESNNSRLFKEDVIKREAEANNINFFQGCQLALDPLVSFGVKQVPEKTNTNGNGFSWNQFCDLADQLMKRELTGHAARDAIVEAMEQSNELDWNSWYRRILIKDLRCGVSEKTINNVVKKVNKDFTIPVFKCMLAHDSANHEKKLIGEKLLDYKLDGVRVLAIYDAEADSVTMYSRNGKQFHNFGHIEKEIVDTLASKFTESMVLDGEMVSSSFQALMKQVHRKDNVEAKDAKFALFDVLTLKEFKEGTSELGCWDRHKQLEDLLADTKPLYSNIFLVDKVECNFDTEEGQQVFKNYNAMAIEKGFEGIMIKDRNAPYECKRSHFMLKAKPFIEVSLEVVDTEEGTGRNEGKLGALICEGEDDGKFIKVNVGSGLTDDNRDEFWASKDKLIGQIVEVRADAITKNQDTENEWSLRFPRFLRFRGFEQGEKI